MKIFYTVLFIITTLNLNAQKMNIETDTTAKCYAGNSILINSDINNVFGILADINNWPAWQSNVSKAVMDGNAEVGKTFKWKSGSLMIRSKLHTVDPSGKIGWTGRIWWITAIHNWYLSDENGKTRVVVKESLKGTGSAKMKDSLNEGMIKNLQELKEYAEKKECL